MENINIINVLFIGNLWIAGNYVAYIIKKVKKEDVITPGAYYIVKLYGIMMFFLANITMILAFILDMFTNK